MNKKFTYLSRFISPVHKAYRQAVLCLEGSGGAELSSSDAHLLAYVVKYGPCTAGELARVFGLHKPTLTGVLDRLEKRGFLKRKLSRRDRRSFEISPRPAGEEYIAIAGQKFERLETAIAEHVTPEEIRGFYRVIEAFGVATGVHVRVGVDARPPNRSSTRDS